MAITISGDTGLGSMPSAAAPAFSVSLSGNQTGQGSGGYLKLQFNTKSGSGLFDTANCFDTTNYRFLPPVAGYYLINGNVNYTGAAVTESFLAVYKNGSILQRGIDLGGAFGSTITALVYLNGSSDYVELYHYFTAGGNKDINGAFFVTNFQGCLLRAA